MNTAQIIKENVAKYANCDANDPEVDIIFMVGELTHEQCLDTLIRILCRIDGGSPVQWVVDAANDPDDLDDFAWCVIANLYSKLTGEYHRGPRNAIQQNAVNTIIGLEQLSQSLNQ